MNMMKKMLCALLAFAMVLGLAACAGTPAPAPASSGEAIFKAGSYTASAPGNYGEIPVTVTFSETAILTIEVGDNDETPGIAKPVFEEIPAKIIEGQTLAVDAISGATNTSVGLLAAIEDCVAQAGGDVAALKAKTVVSGPKDPIEKTVDVVVIGGGGAGLAAATSAAEAGASVILIEKAAALGGNTLRSGGAYNAVDPERQAKVEMSPAQIEELKEILKVDEATVGEYAETLKTLKGQITEYLAGDTSKLFDSVELHTYQIYIGGKRTGNDGTEIYSNPSLAKTLAANAMDALNWVSGYGPAIQDGISTVLGALWPRTHSFADTKLGNGFIQPLADAATKKGAEIMLNTKAEELIVENGRVVGVKATMTDGTPVTLHAEKGVVMATGGYGANAPMCAEYNNYWANIPLDMKSTNTSDATGDGIVMGKAIGANLVGMGYVQLMPSSHPETGSLSGGVWGSAESQVFINKEGKRFVNEYESRDVLSNAALKQTDALFYIICDQNTAGNPQPGDKNGWGDDIDQLVATGSIYRADTLAELAEQIGVPADTLVAEIEKYNTYVEKAADPEFGKNNFGPKIETGPFYATPRSPSIHHTMGGLEINTDCQVLDASGNVIKGFYAAGEVAGGVHAGNRLGGNALADIMVFGRIAGASAAAGK